MKALKTIVVLLLVVYGGKVSAQIDDSTVTEPKVVTELKGELRCLCCDMLLKNCQCHGKEAIKIMNEMAKANASKDQIKLALVEEVGELILPPNERKNTFPPEEFASTADGYRAAAEIPEIIKRIPCYCECAMKGHANLLDCFKSKHAAGCGSCVDEALMAKALHDKGEDPDKIVKEVTEKHREKNKENMVKRLPDSDSEEAKLYLDKCSTCHGLFGPTHHTPQKWVASVDLMDGYMANQMTADEKGKILRYLQKSSKKMVAEMAEKSEKHYWKQQNKSLEERKAEIIARDGEAGWYPKESDKVLSVDIFQKVPDSYAIARELSEIFAQLVCPCEFCKNDDGHKTLLDCFKSKHPARCDMCVDTAILVKDLKLKGESTKDIQNQISKM